MRHSCSLSLAILLWCALVTSFGGSNRLYGQPYDLSFEHIRAEQGLPGSTVYSILQDRYGFIWVGTESGIARYDGYEFVTYGIDSSRSHVGRNVLLEDHSGRLWIGLDSGLYWLDRDQQRVLEYSRPDAERLTDIFALAEDVDGELWVGTSHGLYRLNSEMAVMTRFSHDPGDPASLSDDAVHDVLVGRDGSLWAGTRRGLNRLDKASGAFTRFRHKPGDSLTLSHDWIRTLHEDRDGTLWIGTEEGLNRMNRETGTFTRYDHDPDDPASLHRDRISTIYEGSGGELWVGTWGSTAGGTLHLMDRQAGTFTRYRHDAYDPQSLTRNYSISALHEDRSGVLWVGTGGGYLNKVDNVTRRFVHYRPDPHESGSLGRSFAFAVLQDRHESVWIGMDDGLGRFDRRLAKYTQYEIEARQGVSEAHARVLALAEDREGTIWIGTGDGLHTFSKARQEITPLDLSAPADSEEDVYITEIVEDRRRRLWIGTSTGLRRFDRSRRQLSTIVFDEVDGTPYVTAVCEDRAGRLWIGTRGGLGRYDPESERIHNLPPSIAHLRRISIASIHQDRTGAVWIGTKGDGLWRFTPSDSSSVRIGERYGLASNTILNILEDGLGRIWVRTLTGISWYSPDESRFINYLQKRALGAGLNEWGAMRENEAGEFIFAGDHGLVFFMPEHITTNRVPPQVALTEIKVPGGCISHSTGCLPIDGSLVREEEIRLAHSQNDISFGYVGLHFSNSEQNLYQYMLEPYDREWRAVGNQRKATYTNLSPGEYVFRVMAANADGIWSDGGASLRIVIVPPFWQRTWFYLLCVLLAVALAYVAYRLRVRHLKQHAAELALHVEHRTRELRLEKRKTERQAQRLARLDSAKSRFFANLSHEFRTPLMLIMSPLQDLLDGDYGELSRDVRARVSTMLSNARRLLHLINELLDLARLESGEMKLKTRSGEFVAFLRRLVESFEPLAEHRQITLRFKSRIEGGIYSAAFDEHKLEKVFSNLLSNALKFTPEGGKVWVMLTESWNGEDPGVEVVVKDTGPGIPEEHLSAVFDRFRQSDNANGTRGTGLGLAIAKELVELHGGNILVESELGFGSAFIVRLPLRYEEEREWSGDGDGRAVVVDQVGLELSLEEAATVEGPDESAADRERAAPSDARETVLVVDDNAHVRNYLREHLESTYRVIEAQDGLAAIETARTHRPDLILCDVMIPGIDGIEVCRRVKTDPDLKLIPVLMLTARADVDDRVSGIESGADDYVSKPFSMRELLARIENLTRSRRTMRNAFSRHIVVEPSGVSAASEDEAFLRDVMAVMEERMSESTFNVEALACELGLSRRHLYRKLHALLNESSAEFMRRVRLERAKQLLLAGRLSVSEVAYRVGYSSGSNFARSFRDYYGISPTECTEQAVEETTETGE